MCDERSHMRDLHLIQAALVCWLSFWCRSMAGSCKSGPIVAVTRWQDDHIVGPPYLCGLAEHRCDEGTYRDARRSRDSSTTTSDSTSHAAWTCCRSRASTSLILRGWSGHLTSPTAMNDRLAKISVSRFSRMAAATIGTLSLGSPLCR